MKTLSIALLTIVVSGCASNPYTIPVTTAEDASMVCKKEKPTGSNRPVNVCRPAAGAIDRENTEREMRVLQKQSELIQR